MALSKTTQDHDEIRQWAESRGGKPAEVATTEHDGETGILRFMFPNAPHHNDGSLKEIEWDEFFEKFDKSGLALVYQEQTAGGEPSDFNRFVHPENVSASASSSTATPARSVKAAKKTVAKKAPAKSTPAKKTVVKKAPAKSTPAKKTAAKKAPAKKATTKAPAKKAVTKKTAVKKTVATKAPAKPSTARKSPAKKVAAKKKAAR